jgi:hypothetical protein
MRQTIEDGYPQRRPFPKLGADECRSNEACAADYEKVSEAR